MLCWNMLSWNIENFKFVDYGLVKAVISGIIPTGRKNIGSFRLWTQQEIWRARCPTTGAFNGIDQLSDLTVNRDDKNEMLIKSKEKRVELIRSAREEILLGKSATPSSPPNEWAVLKTGEEPRLHAMKPRKSRKVENTQVNKLPRKRALGEDN